MKDLELQNENILLVDYSNLVARTFYAFNTMTADGLHSGMYFGTLKVLANKIKKHNISRVFICMDKKPYWRTLVLPEYKAGRKGLASSLGDTYESYIEQINDLNTTLNHLQFDMFAHKGYEADDIIAAAVYKYKKNNNVFIYSSDHDFLQLIDKNVTFIKPKMKVNDIIYNERNFEEMMKMTPQEYLDILCFSGDPSDAIPSVFGVRDGDEESGYYWKNPPRVFSEKKAIAILSSKYNTVENLLEGKINPVKGVGPKTNELFLTADTKKLKEAFERNKKLINLLNGDDKLEGMSNIPNQFSPKDVKISVAKHFFSKYECNTLHISDDWPFFVADGGKGNGKMIPVVNKNNFSSLLNRRKK